MDIYVRKVGVVLCSAWRRLRQHKIAMVDKIEEQVTGAAGSFDIRVVDLRRATPVRVTFTGTFADGRQHIQSDAHQPPRGAAGRTGRRRRYQYGNRSWRLDRSRISSTVTAGRRPRPAAAPQTVKEQSSESAIEQALARIMGTDFPSAMASP